MIVIRALEIRFYMFHDELWLRDFNPTFQDCLIDFYQMEHNIYTWQKLLDLNGENTFTAQWKMVWQNHYPIKMEEYLLRNCNICLRNGTSCSNTTLVVFSFPFHQWQREQKHRSRLMGKPLAGMVLSHPSFLKWRLKNIWTWVVAQLIRESTPSSWVWWFRSSQAAPPSN